MCLFLFLFFLTVHFTDTTKVIPQVFECIILDRNINIKPHIMSSLSKGILCTQVVLRLIGSGLGINRTDIRLSSTVLIENVCLFTVYTCIPVSEQ